MPANFRLCLSLLLSLFPIYISAQTDDASFSDVTVTHGPMLGRPTASSMTIWARTDRPGEISIFYGTDPQKLDQRSEPLSTTINRDLTGHVTLDGLSSGTRYHYRIEGHQLSGSFRTLDDPENYRNPETNPEGLFNFTFEFACGNNPKGGGDSVGPTTPVFDVLNRDWRERVDFAILNGDWLYEVERDYPFDKWLDKLHLDADQAPRDTLVAPTLVGVWQNYKTFLQRGRNLSEWHRHMPTYYTADDHELINDIYATAETGYVNRRAVFRDIGVRGWFDYLAWANPTETTAEAWFGHGLFEEGSDVIEDPEARFTELDLEEMANLHVHWGSPTDGVPEAEFDAVPGDPNSAVYEIVEVIDDTRIRVNPPAKADGTASYSIGRRCYGKFTVSNCDFFLLDTRTHRSLHNVDFPDNPEATMLGPKQLAWLKDGISESSADFIFVVSSVNFMVPHVGSGGGADKQETIKKDDAWTVFLKEREELIEFWDELEQPVFVLTGDLHNSFAIRITDNVYEFASGPHNSINHMPVKDEGGRPANGVFQYGPRPCEIRWSSYAMEDIERKNRTFPHFCIVEIKNVFNNPIERGGERWFAFPHPQVIFQFYDGITGEFKYSETIIKGLP